MDTQTNTNSPLIQTGNIKSINWIKILIAVIGIGGLMAVSFYLGHKIPVNTSDTHTIFNHFLN